MIVREQIIINELKCEKIYSDKGYYILEEDNDFKYAHIINLQEYTKDKEYTETDELIPVCPERKINNE